MHGGRRTSRNATRAIVLLGTLALTGAGCSGDDDSERSEPPGLTAAGSSTSTAIINPPMTSAVAPANRNEDGAGGTLRIVLRLTEGAPVGAMDVLVGVMQRRLDTVAVAEPELRNDGERLELVLPGVTPDEQQTLVSLVTRPGAVRVRPVLSMTVNTGSVQTDVAITDPAGPIVLPSADGTLLYTLGPAGADGTIFEPDAAPAIVNGEWMVSVGLRSGVDGEDRWNALAATCYSGASTCPPQAGSPDERGQLAIELDGVVISAPIVNAPSFSAEVSIAGGFGEREAAQLAAILRSGALPPATVESVTVG